MENSFSIGAKEFKLSKVDAFKQFHIVRRLAPILSDLLPAMGSIAKTAKSMDSLSESEKFDQFSKMAGPVMDGLSKLSDADANYVLFGLLQSVEVKQMPVGNWARLSNGDALMFSDMELPVLLQAAGRAFAYNLSGFFGALPKTS